MSCLVRFSASATCTQHVLVLAVICVPAMTLELLLTSLTCSRFIPYPGHFLAEGVAAEIERYSDRYRVNIRANRPALWSVLKLAPAYFPAELLGQGRLSFILSFLPPFKCYRLQDTTEPALVLSKKGIHLFEVKPAGKLAVLVWVLHQLSQSRSGYF